MENFKGVINGRAFEVDKDGNVVIEGPMLDERTREDIRNAARGFYAERERHPQLAEVRERQRRIVSPVPVAIVQPQRGAGVALQPGAQRPPAMGEKWIGVKQLDTAARMFAQLRTNYDCWTAEGHSHGEVMATMHKRLSPLLSGFYWRNIEARMRLKRAWERLQAEVAPEAS